VDSEEREKLNKAMAISLALDEIGEKEKAEEIFQERVEPNIKFIERNDWIEHQICGDWPEVDIRCLAFCCYPVKDCPYRISVLKKLGLTDKDYIEMKRKIGERILSEFSIFT